MRKLFLISVLFALLVPVSAFAAMKFTDMTSLTPNAKAGAFLRWDEPDPLKNGELINRTKPIFFVNGTDHGIMHTIEDGVRYFEDHITFANAQIIVYGDIVKLVRPGDRLDTDTNHQGPAHFTLYSPVAVPTSGVVTRLEITGSAEVSKVRKGDQGIVLLSLQPDSAVFHTYSGTGSVIVRTRRVDARVTVAALKKAFTDVTTSETLPNGFGSYSTLLFH